MKVDRVGDNFTRLEKSQMATINKLQDKIKLLEFDKAQDHATIRDLKALLISKQHSIREVIKEIEKIIKYKNYEKIFQIKKVLVIIERQGMDNE